MKFKRFLILKISLFMTAFLIPFHFCFSEEKLNICLFELDDAGEGDLFSKKMENKKEVNLYRYKPKAGFHGIKGFEQMIQDGKRCDGLMISGHHTGEWYGKMGRFLLQELERLSCNENYKKWFSNIQSLWLDGCNTISDKYLDKVPFPKRSPDSESVRVLKDNKSWLSQNQFLLDLQQAYSGSLDKNTPMSSRYLRIFPNTQIFGFSGAAPQNKQRRWSFIFKHIQSTGLALKNERQVSHLKSNFLKGLEAFKAADYCDEKIESWEHLHPNASAMENQDFSDLRRLGCDLIKSKHVLDNPNADNKEREKAQQKILQVLNRIIEEDQGLSSGANLKYSHLLFNEIYDTWLVAQRQPQNNFFKEVKGALQKMESSIKERIKSPVTASLRKGDYLKLYSEIFNLENESKNSRALFVKQEVDKLLDKINQLFPDLLNTRKGGRLPIEEREMLSLSVLDQLNQYDLLSVGRTPKNKNKVYRSLMKNPAFSDSPFFEIVRHSTVYSDSSEEKVVESIGFQMEQSLDSITSFSAFQAGTRKFIKEENFKGLTQLAQLIEAIPESSKQKKVYTKEFRQDLYYYFTRSFPAEWSKTQAQDAIEKVKVLDESQSLQNIINQLIQNKSNFN